LELFKGKKKPSKKVDKKVGLKKMGVKKSGYKKTSKKLKKKKWVKKSAVKKNHIIITFDNIAVLTLLLFSIIKPDVPKNHLQKYFQTSYRQRQRTEHIYRI